MSASADDNRRWREIGDAVRLLNSTYDGPPPMAEITRIAERHQAKPSDVLMMQRTHRTKGQIEYPDDKSPHIKPRPVDLAGLDHIDDLPHEAPDGKVVDGRSALVTCDRCGTRVSAGGISSHQRGQRCTPETAEPDTTVGASAPPAVAEDEPTPPADPPGTCPAWVRDEYDVVHRCEKPAGHDRLHRCDGDPNAAGPGRCGYLFDDLGMGDPTGVETEHQTPPSAPVDPPGRIDIQFPMTPDAVHEVAGIMAQLDAPHGIAPLTADEQAHASDMALVLDAVLALAMLADQIPDPLRARLAAAHAAVAELHQALRDHHRNADLIAERAVLAARLAEIDQALAPVADTGPEEDEAERVPAPAPEPEVGGGRVDCPECGREFYRNGLPRHMAIHKKKRGAA